MTIEIRLAAGYRANPLGLPVQDGVMLSWGFAGEGSIDLERGVTVEVAPDRDSLESGLTLWSADAVLGSCARYVPERPRAGAAFVWRVTAYDTRGDLIRSAAASFETGLGQSDWSGAWISAPLEPLRRETWEPVALFRRSLELEAVPQRVRLYAAALGMYRLWVNGREVTAESLMRPGWTDFRVRTLHQSYDISHLLHQGENVFAVELSKGWYAGWLGLQREPGFYGDQPALRLQVQAGDEVLLASDASWQRATGDVIAADLLRGESQDLRQARTGWREPGFDGSEWRPALIREDLEVEISPQPHDPVSVYREFEGRLVRAHARGPAVFDFGQNIVGWTRIRTRTHPKADVIVRHGETLTEDKLVWRDNLRSAFQEDRYTTGDGALHTLEPRHTLHGFQYAEVWGLVPETPFMSLEVPDDFSITAIAVGGGQRPVGAFTCSDSALSQVSSMVEWTVRDNFIEVITDCPQRDERLGWLGDAGVIGQTAAYYFDIAAFLAKFTRDASDGQAADGTIRNYVPAVPPSLTRPGAPGWADGYVRLVYLAAERYGDLATAEAHIDSIARYLDSVDRANPNGIRTEDVGADFSDWLSLPENPDEPAHPGFEYTGARSTSSRRVVATAHTIRSYDEYAQLLGWLGREQEARRARARADEIRAIYIDTFIDDQHRIEGDTQTVYAQAINWRIVDGALRSRLAERLAEKIRALGHVTCGIHGSQHVLPALADTGHADLVAELLLRDDMPSWKYMARSGATTVWEKWDAFRPDGTHSTAEMNSLNHCALGAVGEFLFERIAGLDARQTSRTGKIACRPLFIDGLDAAGAEHETIAGPVSSRWTRLDGAVTHEISLSPGLRADYRAPDGWRIEGAEHPQLHLGAGTHVLRLTPHGAPGGIREAAPREA